MAEPAEDRFDVGARFIQIAGRGGQKAYLPCQARVDWFRHDYPEGIIDQELVFHDDKQAIFKSTVTKIRDGVILGRADGYGQEYAKAFDDYLLKAATVSIGRALNALGYGGSDLDEGVADGNIADAPLDRPVGRSAAPAPTPINRSATTEAPRQSGYNPRVTNGRPLSEKQFNKIGVECTERKITDKARHALLMAQFGVESRNDLTMLQASAFIDWLMNTSPEQIPAEIEKVMPSESPATHRVIPPGQTTDVPEQQGLDEDGKVVSWTVAKQVLKDLGCKDKPDWIELTGKPWPGDDPQAAIDLYQAALEERDRVIDGTAGNDRFSR